LWLGRHMPVMYAKVMSSSLVEHYVDMKVLKKKFHRLDLGMRWRLYCLALWGDRFQVVVS
jgi:asparagine synthase (glutamine-hydrolysing)